MEILLLIKSNCKRQRVKFNGRLLKDRICLRTTDKMNIFYDYVDELTKNRNSFAMVHSILDHQEVFLTF